MKTIRKLLASLLALAMLLLLLPAAAFADGAESVLVLPAELKRIEDLAFTYALIRSMGMRFPDCAPDDSLSGDSDGRLTLMEAYRNVTAVLQDIEEQWYRLVDYVRTISSDDELTNGGEHTIDELYALHSQSPRYAGYGESVLFWLPEA